MILLLHLYNTITITPLWHYYCIFTTLLILHRYNSTTTSIWHYWYNYISMTLSTKSTTTSELPLRCCTTTLTMAYHHSHSRMLYLLPLLFLLLPHPCITAASWIIASLDYHCLFGPQPLFGLPRYFWITAVSTYQTKQSVTPISAFYVSCSFFLSQTALQGCDYRSLPNPTAVVCEYVRT